jgi:hypothetical protein
MNPNPREMIPGMPICGRCPKCDGNMFFAHESQCGLCRYCGPGGSGSTSNAVAAAPLGPGTVRQVVTGQSSGHNQPPFLAHPGKSGVRDNVVAPVTASGVSPDGVVTPYNGDPYAIRPGVNAPGPGVAISEPAQDGAAAVSALLQSKGFDKDACPHCTLKSAGMVVDESVVGHLDVCPNNKADLPMG